MSILFGSSMSLIDAATPSGWLLAVDTDGIIKQKSPDGIISTIGSEGITATPSLSNVLSVSNNTGSYSITLGTSSVINTSNGNSLLSLDNLGLSSSVRLSNGSKELFLSNSSNSYLMTNASTQFSVYNSSNTFRISSNMLLDSVNDITLRVFNGSDKILIKKNVGVTVSSANIDTNASIFIGSRNSSTSPTINNTVVLGGTGILANTSNSVYVPDLYIQNSKSIRPTTGTGYIKLDNENNIIQSTNNSLIAIVSSTNSNTFTSNGILVRDTASSSVSSPDINSSISFISTRSSNSDIGLFNSVVIGGFNLSATQSNTVYLGNNVNINNSYFLPTSDGTSGQYLTTDGLGMLYWTSSSETQTLADVLSNGNDTSNIDIILGTSTSLASSNSDSQIKLDYTSSNSILLTTDAGILSSSNIIIDENNITIDSLNTLNLTADSSLITIDSGVGLVYSDDYSDSFLSYSLIDKNYLDLATQSIWNEILSIPPPLPPPPPGISKVTIIQNFTASITETINHNLMSEDIIVQTYDSLGNYVIPGEIKINGANDVDITFSATLADIKIIIIG